MVKTIVKAKKNFETLFESVNQMIAEFEEKKAKAIEVAIAQVEEDFKADKETLDNLFAQVSETEEVEVPDEEEVSEDVGPNVEEQPAVDTLY